MTVSTPRGGLRKVRRGHVQVPSQTIRDEALSYRARGVLAFLLDHPDGWTVDSEYIASKGREGRDAIETALRELRAAGYYRLERRRLADGTFAMGTAIAEEADPEWVDSHRRHGGRAVPCRVLEDGRVVELAPLPEPDSQGPADQGPENLSPVDLSPVSRSLLPQTERTDREGETPQDLSQHRTCPAHRLTPATGPCGRCGDHRRAYEEAADELAQARRAREHADRQAARTARALADAEHAACGICDETGTAYVDTTPVRCLHDADRNRRALDGRRAARAAIATRTQEA